MLTYLVNNRARRKMKVYLYRARSGDDALARIPPIRLGCEGNALYLKCGHLSIAYTKSI